MKTENELPENEMLNKIMEQIEIAKKNQKEFVIAMDEFFTQSDKINDSE